MQNPPDFPRDLCVAGLGSGVPARDAITLLHDPSTARSAVRARRVPVPEVPFLRAVEERDNKMLDLRHTCPCFAVRLRGASRRCCWWYEEPTLLAQSLGLRRTARDLGSMRSSLTRVARVPALREALGVAADASDAEAFAACRAAKDSF